MFAASGRHLALILALCLGALLAAPTAHAQYFALAKGTYPLEFYDIDFSGLADPQHRNGALDALHYIPVALGADAYLSLGGELREQSWDQVNEAYALRSPAANSYDLQRAAIDAYLHVNSSFSVFGELARADAYNKISASTTDEDRGRLQQGFVQFRQALGATSLWFRVGRQEITLGSGRFVWVNDSSNVRTTHDGVRLHADVPGGTTFDFIASRPVTSTYGAFADWTSHSGSFDAVYVSEPLVSHELRLDEYFYHRLAPATQFAALTGTDERSTAGGRLWGGSGGLEYDADVAYQWGAFYTGASSKGISALGGSARVLYSFDRTALDPGIQLQASYFSGSDDAGGRSIGTFSAPFPRPTMLNYAGLDALENLIEAYPSFLINPVSELAFRFGPQLLWRANTNDAVYISRATPLTRTLDNTARYIGTGITSTAQWVMRPNVILFGEYVHQLAGDAITRAGGRGADIGVVQLDLNF